MKNSIWVTQALVSAGYLGNDNAEAAAELLRRSQSRQSVDVAQVEDRCYLLRDYTSISWDQAASRDLEDKYHFLVYPKEVVKMLEHMPHARHTVILDGEKMDVKTITCFVNNIYNLDGFDSVVNKKR